MKISNVEVHLFRFNDENPENTIYFLSTKTDHKYLRNQMDRHDHGGMIYEDFERVWQTGEIEEITEKSQIPKADLRIIPFSSDEWVEEWNDYFEFDYEIGQLFNGSLE